MAAELYRVSSQNETDLLRHLARHGAMSRADLARAMGVMRSTVGNVVNRLIQNEVVCLQNAPSDEAGERSVGRPGALISLNGAHCHFLSAQIGVGYVRVLCTDLACRIVAIEEEDVPPSEQSPNAVAAILERLAARAAGDRRLTGGFAVAVPGVVDHSGVVLRAPNIGWLDVPLADILAPHLRRWGPVLLENDANAFVLAEIDRHVELADETAVFMWIDAGIGGGIAAHGALLRGADGLAGEIGHIFVGPGTQHARLEDLAGRDALLRRARALGGSAASLDAFLTDFDAEDRAARDAAKEWVDVMSRALASLSSTLNPSSIVFGGPMTVLLERVRQPLEERLNRLQLPGSQIPQIVISEAGRDAVALGGAYRQRDQFFAGR